MLKLDWKVLNKYIRNNLIIANKHSEYDLWILNYSPKVKLMKLWDDITIRCRGLVIDNDGHIIGNVIKKFFNLDESNFNLTENIEYEIFENLDGSQISIFYYHKEKKWIISSRWSFISEQVIEANKMMNNKPNIFKILNKNCTYIFEIIYKSNKTVIDYGNLYDIILITKIINKNGNEISYDIIHRKYKRHFTIVKKINIKVDNLIELKYHEEHNKVGYVIKFSDNTRLKIKFKEYVKLYSVLKNVSQMTIWEYLRNNYDINLLSNTITEKHKDLFNKIIEDLYDKYNNVERLAIKEFIKIFHINNITDRIEFAHEAINSEYNLILFKIFDKKPYDYIIWNMIKPKFNFDN